MSFTVQLTRSAKHELKGLSRDVQARVAQVLRGFVNEPFPFGYRKLRGGLGYRVRIGDYRILYYVEIPSRVVTVAAIVHRKDAY